MRNSKLQVFFKVFICVVGTVCVISLLLRGSDESVCPARYNTILSTSNHASSMSPDIQQEADRALTDGMESSRSKKGLIVVQRVSTGEITAIAAQEGQGNKKCYMAQAEAFRAWEPGSVVKPLIAAAALNEHKLDLNDTFYNKGLVRAGDDQIVNALNIPQGDYSYQDMVSRSINLGAVEALKRLSDDGQIDAQSKRIWRHYLTDVYGFGLPTGAFNQEQHGYIPGLANPLSSEARYARTSFGVGLTVTPVQLTTAYAMLVNRGIYVAPTLHKSTGKEGRAQQHISQDVSNTARDMLQAATIVSNYAAVREGYSIGGKSGTAPSADETGNYQYYRSIGTYIGFVGGKTPEYIVLVKLDEPKDEKVLASSIAAKLWARFVGSLVDNNLITE